MRDFPSEFSRATITIRAFNPSAFLHVSLFLFLFFLSSLFIVSDYYDRIGCSLESTVSKRNSRVDGIDNNC